MLCLFTAECSLLFCKTINATSLEFLVIAKSSRILQIMLFYLCVFFVQYLIRWNKNMNNKTIFNFLISNSIFLNSSRMNRVSWIHGLKITLHNGIRNMMLTTILIRFVSLFDVIDSFWTFVGKLGKPNLLSHYEGTVR